MRVTGRRVAVVAVAIGMSGLREARATPTPMELPATKLRLTLDDALWQIRPVDGRDAIVFRGLMDQQLELRPTSGTCAAALAALAGELDHARLEVATAGWLPPTFDQQVVRHIGGMTLCHERPGQALRVDVLITPEAVSEGGGDPAALQQYEALYPGVLQAIADAIAAPIAAPPTAPPAPPSPPPSSPTEFPNLEGERPRPAARGSSLTAPDLRAGFAMFDPGAARSGYSHVGFAVDAGYRWRRPRHAFALSAGAAALGDGAHMWRLEARAGLRQPVAIFDVGLEVGGGGDAIGGDFTYVPAAPYGTVAVRLELSAFTYEFAYVRRAADDGDIDRERRHLVELGYALGRRRLVFGASLASVGTATTDGGDALGIYFGYVN